MVHLIDKDTLVVEIKRRLKFVEKRLRRNNSYSERGNAAWERDEALDNVYNSLLYFINTLEVEEVDLEKIINDYFKDWKFDDELDIMVKPNNYSASFTDLKEIAKHFFELGLKAQKGK